MDDVIAHVELAMAELGEGTAQNEPRRRVYPPGGVLNVMFASYPGGNCTGLKAYSVANGRARFLLTVFGLDGSLLALIEADFLGSYRTGAASAVAIRKLGPQLPANVAVIGAGWQASTQVLGLSRVLTINELRVYSRNRDGRVAFAKDQAEQLGIEAFAVETAREAVRGADVVVTITTSQTPVLQADWVEPAALVIAAGSNYPHRTELPQELVERAQTVVVDQLAAAQLDSGDLIQAHRAGKFDWSRAVEFGDVVAGKWRRPSEPGITLFESHGLALWDLAAAVSVLPAARKRGMSEELSLLEG